MMSCDLLNLEQNFIPIKYLVGQTIIDCPRLSFLCGFVKSVIVKKPAIRDHHGEIAVLNVFALMLTVVDL
jgi:hypothetical protein